MHSPLILVVGKELQSLSDQLRVEGYDFIILRDRQTTDKPDAAIPGRIVCDFNSRKSTLARIDTIKRPVTAVMTLYENYVLPTAWINEHLGLAGMPVAVARACTDKFLMRKAFATASQKISPDFALVQSEAGLRQFAADHTFPLILKPANLAKSLLVTKSNSLDELLAHYVDMIERIGPAYKQYAPNRQPRIVVEEFLAGSLHSVAAFVDKTGTPHLVNQIVDLTPAQAAGFNDNFIYCRTLPSSLGNAQQSALRSCAAQGIAALGMNSTPAHVEIILTADGPRIVEIGARNGGYRERMYRLANDIDIIRATVDIATSKQPALGVKKDGFCSVIELFPHRTAAFKAISSAEQVSKLASCKYFVTKPHQGDTVGPASEGYKCCAVIMLYNANQQQLTQDLQFVRQNVSAIVE